MLQGNVCLSLPYFVFKTSVDQRSKWIFRTYFVWTYFFRFPWIKGSFSLFTIWRRFYHFKAAKLFLAIQDFLQWKVELANASKCSTISMIRCIIEKKARTEFWKAWTYLFRANEVWSLVHLLVSVCNMTFSKCSVFKSSVFIIKIRSVGKTITFKPFYFQCKTDKREWLW